MATLAELDGEAEVDALWEDEILKRIATLNQGLTERIPAAEVFQELDQKLANSPDTLS